MSPMRLNRSSITSFVICLATLLCYLPLAAPANSGLTIGVSILPQKYFVERIAGKNVRVIVMVGPGHSPATYEPQPRQMAQLSEAALYFLMGVPFEMKWSPLFSQINPRMKIVAVTEGINLRKIESHADTGEETAISGHAHSEEVWDPHIWLNPRLVEQLALVMKTEIINIDPVNRTVYENNYQAFVRDLRVLDATIRQQLASVRHKYFMVFHPSWGYFADEYGLVQVPIEYQGKQPGARALSEIIATAKQKVIKVVFVQKQFSERNAVTLASQIGASVVQVDPLAENYIENLANVSRQFAEAMQ